MTPKWLFVPNIIGYVRILLLAAFFFVAAPLFKASLITISLLLDILDGKTARWLNQSTLFGSRFDLIIDMFTLALLSFYVAYHCENPWFMALFIFGGLNDIVNYMLSLTVFYGKKTPSSIDHKKALKEKGFLLPIYYSTLGLGLFNILHDAFLIAQVYQPSFIAPFVIYIFLLGYLFRQLSNIEQAFRLIKLAKSTSPDPA